MKTIDRVLSFLLALVMVLSLSPAPFALAEEPEGTIAPVSETTPEPEDPPEDPNEEGEIALPADEPAAEPRPDEPQDDTYAFTLQPYSGKYAPTTLRYTAYWDTNFNIQKIEIIHVFSGGEYEIYDTVTDPSHFRSYSFPATSGTQEYYVRAYYGTGPLDYRASTWFTVSDESLIFTRQPESGTYSPTTLVYTANWDANFNIQKIVIIHVFSSGEYEFYDTVTDPSRFRSYSFPATSGTQEYYVRAYYGTGPLDYRASERFTVSEESLIFTLQPESGTYSPTTLVYTANWDANFNIQKIVIIHVFSGGEYEFYDTVTDPSRFRSYSFPATSGTQEYYVRAYYGTGPLDYRASERFTVSDESLIFTLQPESGTYSPTTLVYTANWDANFNIQKIVIIHVFSGGEYEFYDTVTDPSRFRSYSFPATSGTQEYYVRAYYGSGTLDYLVSDWFTVSDSSLVYTVQPQSGVYDPISLSYTATWDTNFNIQKIEVCRVPPSHQEELVEVVTNPSRFRSYTFSATNGTQEYYIKAYYGSGALDYLVSDWFTVYLDPPTSGTCGVDEDNLLWSFDETTGTLTISGEGTMAYYSANTVPWRFLRNGIQTVVIEEGVEDVSDYAFSNCPALATVYLPSTLTEIEDYAFDNCPALADAHINMSLQQFSAVTWDKTKNTGLRDAAKHFAFIAEGQAGPSLTWKLANDGVLSFSGSGAMYNWTSSDPAPWYPYRSSVTQVRLAKVTTVGDYAFFGCSKLSSASFPSDLTYLGVRAFSGCSSLAAVYWAAPSYTNLTEIRDACFAGCTALQSFPVPKKCAVIGQAAFSGCDALTTVSFPADSALTTVGKRAFYSCDNLGNINLPEGVTSLGDEAFLNCKSLTSFPLPSTLTSLGEYCFHGCSGVTGVVTIPAGIEEIPNRCFLGCSGFYKLALSPTTNQIGPYAFYGCSKLTNVDYDGFRAQWEQVAVSNNNAPLTGAQFSWLYRYGTLSNGTVNWALFGATGKLVISGTRSMPTWVNAQSAPWYQYAPYIQVIDVHASVEKIGAFAFRNCSALTTLYLPGTITSVGYFAFNESTALADVWYDGPEVDWEEVSIDNGNIPLLNARKHFTELGGVVDGTDLYWTLDDNGVLTVFHDPDNLDWGEMAIPDFQDPGMAPWYPYRDRIHAIHVQENVTGIGGGAFNDIPDLREVEISDSVTEIGDYVFDGCGGAFSVTIPDSVTVMWTRAFQNCTGLNAATVGSGVTAIPYGTFSNCGSLETVTIPATVTGIAENAFYNCSGLQDVYFAGTSAQWKAITKGSGNDALNTATIHFVPPEIKVDAINFPDAKFRAYVAENIDTDGSGWLTDAECRAVTRIDCQSQSIASLQGLAFFPRLGVLICSDNNLDELDLSANPILMNLNCNGNPLVELDLSANPLLTSVECVNCSLTELDLSGNTALWQLYCSDNALTVLDLSGNPRLGYLDCAGNRLATLDLSPCTGLQKVYCQNNGMTALTLGRQEALQQLACYGNSLASVDLTESTLLKNAVLNGTRTAYNTSFGNFVEFRSEDDYVRADPSTVLMTTPDGIPVDAVHFPDASFRSYVAATLDPNGDLWLTPAEIAAVTEIVCQEMRISSLTGIGYFPNLEILMCGSNDLTALDLSGNTKLVELDCSENDLSALNVSGLSDLEILNVNGNAGLSGLNLSANTALEELSVQACGLSALVLSSNVNLWYLDCSDNNLSALNLSGNPALKELYCDNNELTSLDLSHNPALYYVSCFNNAITSLDVSTNTALKELYCDNNALTSLTLGELPALKELYCYHNNLTSLDLRGCPLIQDMVLTEETTTYEDWVYYTKTTAEGVFYEFDVDPDVILITATYILSGFEAAGTGFRYWESLGRYWLNSEGRVQTPLWKDGIAPDFQALSSYGIGGPSLDEAGVQMLKTEPEVDGIYYVSYSFSTSTQGQGCVDFSELSTANCKLTVPGYEISCIRVTPGTTSGGYDNVRILFKLCRLLPIDEAHFPCEAFRAYVAENFDADGDGYLRDAECEAVTAIHVDAKGLTSLRGIEYFYALTELSAEGNAIESVDLSYNLALTNVSLAYCGLWSLDLTGLERLKVLDVSGNNLASLDVSDSIELTDLYCSENSLAALGVSALSKLVTLYCDNNEIEILDLSHNPALMRLGFDANPLTAIDLSRNTGLTEIGASSCSLTQLDVSMLPQLVRLDCYGNPLQTLKLGTLGNLERLACYETPEDLVLDISGCPLILDAYLNGTQTTTDIPGFLTFVTYKNGSHVLEIDPDQKILTQAYLPGDINGDKVVDGEDVTCLIRYLKYGGVTVVEAALDVNGDGLQDNRDVTRLIRFVYYREGVVH